VTATQLDVAPSPAGVAVNGTFPLMAIARDADGTAISGVQVSWTTANENVATVDMTGLVTGVATGITMIWATGGGAAGSTRVTVGTPDNPFARIAFSSIHTVGNYACGLEAQTGLAYCWGDNHAGALGIGEVDGSDTPVLVTGTRRFRSLSVGFYGNCAVEAGTGLAYCWGFNRFGDLGDDTFTTRWVPTLVQSGGVRFTSISASGELSCGVAAETGLGYCWGREGRIGDGTLVRRSVPTLVESGGATLRFTSISVGGHACGVEAETGHGYCWGPNESGQLGDGTTIDRLVPTLVAGGRLRFSSISPGDAATCGVEAETGSAYCWGSNAVGQLGDGTTTARLEPAIAGSALRLATVSSRGDMVCGIEEQTGVAHCWGRGYTGGARLVPTMVGNDRVRFSSISVGGGACAVEAQTGRGYCWGDSLVPTALAPLVSSAMR
jgi:alpha-tubulin suppressor-like RCC1 family protein